MQKAILILLSIFLSWPVFNSCRDPKASGEEEIVLNSLKKIQDGVEANISYENFTRLLEETKPKLDMLKAAERKNACFVSAVDRCYCAYVIAAKAWKLKQEAQSEQRKEDMQTTFSFSVSLASLNIERASSCYK
jgi:hypothetical protein